MESRVGPDMTEVRVLCIPLEINDGGGRRELFLICWPSFFYVLDFYVMNNIMFTCFDGGTCNIFGIVMHVLCFFALFNVICYVLLKK